MNKSRETIRKDMFHLYTALHDMSQCETAPIVFSKDLLKYLKYDAKEVEQALDISDGLPERAKPKMKTEIVELQTKEQVLHYFREHILPICQPDTMEEEKTVLLKKITLEEIGYIYQLVFGIPLTGKYKKIDVIYKIKDFFDNEERTQDLIKTI